VALAVGLLGGYIIYVFMAKVLMSPDAVLDPADSGWKACWDICRTHPRGGTGELIYTQAGNPANLRRAQRRRRCHCEGNGSDRDALRARARLCAHLG